HALLMKRPARFRVSPIAEVNPLMSFCVQLESLKPLALHCVNGGIVPGQDVNSEARFLLAKVIEKLNKPKWNVELALVRAAHQLNLGVKLPASDKHCVFSREGGSTKGQVVVASIDENTSISAFQVGKFKQVGKRLSLAHQRGLFLSALHSSICKSTMRGKWSDAFFVSAV